MTRAGEHDIIYVDNKKFCTICAGLDKSLTTTCRGGLLYSNVLSLVAEGRLDYVNGEWFYAENAGEAKQAFENFIDT